MGRQEESRYWIWHFNSGGMGSQELFVLSYFTTYALLCLVAEKKMGETMNRRKKIATKLPVLLQVVRIK